jgi:flagellar motility protein MotE (MotC chaperone)
MKSLFLLVCIVAAVSYSLLGIIYGTGEIPFSKTVNQEAASPIKTEVVQEQNVFQSDEDMVNELHSVLEAERKAYGVKMEELVAKEKEFDDKQKIIETLKSDLEGLYDKVNSKLIVMDESEGANFKRLAMMYSKMDAEGAANLMTNMKPERAAAVLNLIAERQAAGILSAAVAKGDGGTRTAVEWSDIIRRMENTKKKGG